MPLQAQDYELPPNVNATTSAAEALAGAQFAIHAVPVQHTRAFLQSIKARPFGRGGSRWAGACCGGSCCGAAGTGRSRLPVRSPPAPGHASLPPARAPPRPAHPAHLLLTRDMACIPLRCRT